MKVNKKKVIRIDDNGDVYAKYDSAPTTFWDLAEHSQNDCLNNVLGAIDHSYHIERKFNNTCNAHAARAVCNDADTYDENKGIQIACTKSDWKYHNNMRRRYRQYYGHVCKLLDELADLEAFHNRKCKHIERYLEDM